MNDMSDMIVFYFTGINMIKKCLVEATAAVL